MEPCRHRTIERIDKDEKIGSFTTKDDTGAYFFCLHCNAHFAERFDFRREKVIMEI